MTNKQEDDLKMTSASIDIHIEFYNWRKPTTNKNYRLDIDGKKSAESNELEVILKEMKKKVFIEEMIKILQSYNDGIFTQRYAITNMEIIIDSAKNWSKNENNN